MVWRTIPGVNVITAVKILAEIGDIKRFGNANKLAQFAGIAPLHLSSSGKGKDVATKQGNRRLQATIYFLAIQMVQVSSKGSQAGKPGTLCGNNSKQSQKVLVYQQ